MGATKMSGSELRNKVTPQLSEVINIQDRMLQPIADPRQLSPLIEEADKSVRATLGTLVQHAPKTKRSSVVISIGSAQTYLRTARFERLTKICLALPGVRTENIGNSATFLVDGRTFAYYLSDYRGNGITGVCCRLRSGKTPKPVLSAMSPWFNPTSGALNGWLGLRLDRSAIDWGDVFDLVQGSYLRVAPLSTEL
ncbi:hypothetical protein ACPOL_4776 [Acidisarcina polymorpha]|uniref:Uncharacterized protein n=1 Tax=Acidisarcina polymorpha TaxID=2211140 RepID=A0A2Z5G4G9_9BACT|nr:hypothetical protein [Acidisarcina polymorpha]AXC14042.1 hypothetical protein ACPOL_4776 [Acidisarcina polymorpha]